MSSGFTGDFYVNFTGITITIPVHRLVFYEAPAMFEITWFKVASNTVLYHFWIMRFRDSFMYFTVIIQKNPSEGKKG